MPLLTQQYPVHTDLSAYRLKGEAAILVWTMMEGWLIERIGGGQGVRHDAGSKEEEQKFQAVRMEDVPR